MIKNLIEFASELDEKGLHLEASRIDEVIAKMATGDWDLQIEDTPGFAEGELAAEYNDDVNRLMPLAEVLILGGTPIRGTTEEGDADVVAASRELAVEMQQAGLLDAGEKIFELLRGLEPAPEPEPAPEAEQDKFSPF